MSVSALNSFIPGRMLRTYSLYIRPEMKTPSSADDSIATGDTPAATRKSRRTPPLSLAAWKQFLSLAKPYWLGDQKGRAWLLLALLIVLMLVETKLAVMLNDQAGEMTSALAGKDRGRFWTAVK